MHSNASEPIGRSTRLLAACLHGILRACSEIYLGTRRLKGAAKYRYQARTDPTAVGIAAMVSALNKVPRHLSAVFDGSIFDDGTASDRFIQDAAAFAAWSVVAGISTIFRSTISEIFASLRVKEFVPGQRHRISIYVDGRELPTKEYIDDAAPSLTIYLISEDDGRRVIGSITEALAEKIKDGAMTIDEISVRLLAEQLHSAVMPAPDLVVVFGRELKLSGYPPWHLQQPEMEMLRDHDGFSYVAFASALQSYAGAEMRHGK